MTLYHCKNFANCGNSVEHRGELCAACQDEQRQLERNTHYDAIMRALNSIDKQDGQHRRRDKRGRR